MKKQMKYVVVLLHVLVIFLVTPEGHANEKGHMIGITDAHNAVRSQFGIPDLIWSDDIADHAQQWANYLARENKCKMKHRPRTGQFARIYGENLYWASPIRWSSGKNERQEITPDIAVASWEKEKKNYNYSDNSCNFGKSCGHYTQVLWKDSKKLGCGMSFCSDNSQIWVCNYDPPGNLIGEKPY